MLKLREQIRSWRFYDHFRTDVDAPARLPQIGTHTPVLSNDGADLAAALQTILEIGDPAAMADAVADAFPGSSISVLNTDGRFEIAMHQHGLLRPLRATDYRTARFVTALDRGAVDATPARLAGAQ